MLQELLESVRTLRSTVISNRSSLKNFRPIADRLGSIETILLEEIKSAGEAEDKQIPIPLPDESST